MLGLNELRQSVSIIGCHMNVMASWQLNCLFNSLFRQTANKKIIAWHYWHLVRGIPCQQIINAEGFYNVQMSSWNKHSWRSIYLISYRFARVFYRLSIQYAYGRHTTWRLEAARLVMIMSSNGNIFRVTGPLCGEFTGPRWIPLTKASDAELWCFLSSVPE